MTDGKGDWDGDKTLKTRGPSSPNTPSSPFSFASLWLWAQTHCHCQIIFVTDQAWDGLFLASLLYNRIASYCEDLQP